MFEISFKSPIIEPFCSFSEEQRNAFRHASMKTSKLSPLSLSLPRDNHFPYTCIEFNYKNISGKKGGGEQIVFEIKIALNYNDDAM